MKRLLYGTIILLFFNSIHLAGYSQVVVRHIDDLSAGTEGAGVIYNLPRTVMKFDFTFTQVREFRGPFATYAPNLLGIEDVILENDRYYRIDDVKISSFTEPDPDQYYHVMLAEKADRELFLKLGKSGIISGTLQEEEFAGQAVMAESFRGGIPDDLFPGYIRTAKIEKTDTIRRVVTIDTTSIEKYILRRFLEEKTEENKAREAADMINRLKEDKYKLLVGYQETPYDKGAMEFMYNKLEAMERSYLELFTGIRMEESITRSAYFVPGPEDKGSLVPLLAFSEDEGPYASDADESIFIEFIPEQEWKEGPVSPEGDLTGFVYRVPPTVVVNLLYDGEKLLTSRQTVNQFGILKLLPRGVKEIVIDPETGSVGSVRISLE